MPAGEIYSRSKISPAGMPDKSEAKPSCHSERSEESLVAPRFLPLACLTKAKLNQAVIPSPFDVRRNLQEGT
jgi:hypothetical protein